MWEDFLKPDNNAQKMLNDMLHAYIILQVSDFGNDPRVKLKNPNPTLAQEQLWKEAFLQINMIMINRLLKIYELFKKSKLGLFIS